MPVELNFAERRVLGVLIEKGFTTPEQYPLSLNAVVVGSNQKSCRDPLSALDEEKALDSLESLRQKGFATLVRMEGSRVDRWKQRLGETLGLEAREVAVLGELLLRGPQTDGELRQRASRMRPIESLEELERLIESLRGRPEPLVERLGPPGRRRGVKYAHAFYPPHERPGEDAGGEGESGAGEVPSPADHDLPEEEGPRVEDRALRSAPAYSPQPSRVSVLPLEGGDAISALRREVEALKERVAELEATFVKFLK